MRPSATNMTVYLYPLIVTPHFPWGRETLVHEQDAEKLEIVESFQQGHVLCMEIAKEEVSRAVPVYRIAAVDTVRVATSA